MKILFLSDTHGRHSELSDLPKADILIHAGDVSRTGTEYEIKDFLNWFSSQDYKYKVFIAGNHDFYFDSKTIEEINSMLKNNEYYLCNSGITIEGINIWGSPITPIFFDWAFNKDRGEEISKYWGMIPNNTDVLVTHGPPLGMLDCTYDNLNVGCEDLRNRVKAIKPKYHLFGHIHEGYGMYFDGTTTYVNGSILNERYCIKNKPYLLRLV